MTRLLSSALLATALSIACARPPTSIPNDERLEIETEVRAAVAAFADAEQLHDPDAILELIASDFYMYADGTRVDYETVVEQIRSTMTSLQALETTWSDIEVTVLARDHALVTLLFRDVVTDANGVTTRLRGPTTFVWRLRDRAWRIIYADAVHYPDEATP